MGVFRYRLERLLALRRMREGIARDAAAAGAMAADRGKAELDRALAALLNATESLARPGCPAVPAARLSQASRYAARLRDGAILAEARAGKAADESRRLTAAAVEAWRARRVLEELRARKLAVWTRAMLTAAQRELDDVSGTARWRTA